MPDDTRVLVDALQFIGTISAGAWVTMLMLAIIEWTNGGHDAG